MKTPIADFVKGYAESDFSRLHMPGHKGTGLLGCEKYDITEIDGADVLYSATGIIKESEKNAAELFGTAATYYSTEGSSLAIKAMLTLVCRGKKERPLILAARNVHKAFIYAAALLDFDVEWMYGKNSDHLCSLVLSADEVEQYIQGCRKIPDAVYITSPDYLGGMWHTEEISALCERYGIPLLVDNAHGAYLGFLEKSLHPVSLGATMCCDSAHKTLPVLTPGAYLHIAEKGRCYIPDAEACLALHATTSPSYLILQSLDLCNSYLSDGYTESLSATVKKIEGVKKELRACGFDVKESEPLKITLSPLSKGYTGLEVSEQLCREGIFCEFSDRDIVVLMLTPENSDNDYKRLLTALKALPEKEKKLSSSVLLSAPAEKKLTIRQAIFSPDEYVSTEEAENRICAAPVVSCPPAVPVAVSGEIITAQAIDIFRACGIEKIKVVK